MFNRRQLSEFFEPDFLDLLLVRALVSELLSELESAELEVEVELSEAETLELSEEDTAFLFLFDFFFLSLCARLPFISFLGGGA